MVVGCMQHATRRATPRSVGLETLIDPTAAGLDRSAAARSFHPAAHGRLRPDARRSDQGGRGLPLARTRAGGIHSHPLHLPSLGKPWDNDGAGGSGSSQPPTGGRLRVGFFHRCSPYLFVAPFLLPYFFSWSSLALLSYQHALRMPDRPTGGRRASKRTLRAESL